MHYLGRRPLAQQIGFNHVTAIELFGFGQRGLVHRQYQFAPLGLEAEPLIDLQFGRPRPRGLERHLHPGSGLVS